MLHAVIMAGGSGTRFWPESRAERPKQLLRLAGDRTMLQMTVDRLGNAVPQDRVLVATTAQLAPAVAKQLPELPPDAILGEPCKRDTAPCIGLAAMYVSRDDPDATMVVMPADHVISPDEAFQRAILYGATLVDERPKRIVTFGIRPTYPAEIFGYVERGEAMREAAGDGFPTYRVRQFREKPKAEVAREYLESGNFYWNSGIFIWKARTIIDQLAEHQSEMHAHLARIADAHGTPDAQGVLEREFAAIHGVSIDYAVMEHAEDIAVVETPFEWDDLGGWQALARIRGHDEHGNTIIGRYLGLNTEGSIIRGQDDHLVVTLGLKDCIVVQTPDATLVANKHDEESIREVVRMIREQGWEEYL